MSAKTGNIFAALQKSTKSKSKSKDSEAKKEKEDPAHKHAELEKAIFSAPAAGLARGWASESEDEDEHPVHQFGDGWNEVRPAASIARPRRYFGARALRCTCPRPFVPAHATQAKGAAPARGTQHFAEQAEPEPESDSEEEEVRWPR